MPTPINPIAITRILSRKAGAFGVPVSGFFELTPRCNLRCRMCYVRMTPEQMKPIGTERTAAQWLELGRTAAEQGMIFLLLTGGEPFLRPDFPEIYEGLTKLGLSISINTNGTLLTSGLKELFHRLPPAYVNVTLYGLDETGYETLCGDGAAYHKVMDALDWFRSEGILTHLNVTLTPTNQSRWEDFENFAAERKLSLRMTTYCFPPSRRDGHCPDFERLEPERAGELTARDQLRQRGPAYLRQMMERPTPPQSGCDLDCGEPIPCLAAKSQFWITWDGRMLPCCMLPSPETHPFEQGFCAAWAQLQEQTRGIRLCADCATCPDRATCTVCAAVTITETGSYTGRPDYVCRMNKAYRQTVAELANENK